MAEGKVHSHFNSFRMGCCKLGRLVLSLGIEFLLRLANCVCASLEVHIPDVDACQHKIQMGTCSIQLAFQIFVFVIHNSETFRQGRMSCIFLKKVVELMALLGDLLNVVNN